MRLHRHYVIAAVIVLMIIACLLWVKQVLSPWPLAICTPAAGVITFFALLADPKAPSSKVASDERLRQVIAAAVLVQYLVLVGISAYFLNGAPLPPLTETMLNSFTTVTSVVIAFYFGASAFVDASKAKAPPDSNGTPANKA